MPHRKFIAVTCIFWAGLGMVSAQDKIPQRSLTPSYSRNILSSDQELFIDCVWNVFQDARGRLWLQTCGEARESGIHQIQFDGYNFQMLRYDLSPEQAPKLANFFSVAQGITASGNLFGNFDEYVENDKGSFILNLNTEELSLFPLPQEVNISWMVIYDMITTSDSTYQLLSANKGMMQVSQLTNGEWEQLITVRDSTIISRYNGWNHGVLKDRPSEAWLLGIALPLIRYDKATQTVHKYNFSDFDTPPIPVICKTDDLRQMRPIWRSAARVRITCTLAIGCTAGMPGKTASFL